MKFRPKLIFFFVILLIIFYFGARFTGRVIADTNTCIDTDFGKNYYSFGEVRGDAYLLSKEPYELKDECLDDKTLVEYFCVGEGNNSQLYPSSEKYKCPDGCDNGKCLGNRRTGVEEPGICEGLLWCKVKKLFS